MSSDGDFRLGPSPVLWEGELIGNQFLGLAGTLVDQWSDVAVGWVSRVITARLLCWVVVQVVVGIPIIC